MNSLNPFQNSVAFIETDDLKSILEAPCREIKPVEPFPFKSSRISHGIRFQHYLILSPFYPEYKKCQHLYTFNLLTRKWGSAQLTNSPEILENTDNFKILPDNQGGFILLGCFKKIHAKESGNLFDQSVTVTLKKVLGYIAAQVYQDELVLQWGDFTGADQLPYLEKFSANLIGNWVYIFGGCDENSKATNNLFRINLVTKETEQMDLHSKNWQAKDQIPCPRMNHSSMILDDFVEIFGGEDENNNPIKDSWMLQFKAAEDDVVCVKLDRKEINRTPKLGTPCLNFGINQASTLYIAKGFQHYLCADRIDHDALQIRTWSQKDPLPFNGIPHTMDIFENQLILGFESSIYSFSFSGVSPTPDFQSFEKAEEEIKKTQPKNFKGYIRQYFEEKPFPDVKFNVQGKEVGAHRGILSVRCLFFRELFEAKRSEKDKSQPIEITDLLPIAFNALLEWLYCDEILDLKDEIAVELLKVTDKYSLPKLRIEAEKCLVKNLTIDNILERAKLAVENSALDLETTAVKFIVRNLDDVKKRQEFDDLPSPIIERVENMKTSEKKLNSLLMNTFEMK